MANEELDLEGLHDDENAPVIEKELEEEEITDDKPVIEDTEITKEKDTDEPVLTGMEKFLSDYGIVAGLIEFEGGEQKHFDELNDDEKYNVISTLIEKNSEPIEAKYGLEPEEVSLLNYFRGQDKPINEALDALFEARIQQLQLHQSVASTDYETMDKDAIYLKWLKENNPEATAEDLQEDLEIAKKSKSYEKSVEGLKKTFIETQNKEIKEAQEEERRLQELEIDSDRKEIVKHVSTIEEVAGFPISDEEKNEVLEDLLEVNDNGDSKFMEEVFSDPNKLFKAAWLYKKGEVMFDEMSNYYKKEISKAYKKGKDDALAGAPSRPISGTDNNKQQIQNRDIIKAKTLDELHSDSE